MDEIVTIVDKYKNSNIETEISDFPKLIKFSASFYKDVADIYDAITRIRHLDRNLIGFNFNDAAILGLMIYPQEA